MGWLDKYQKGGNNIPKRLLKTNDYDMQGFIQDNPDYVYHEGSHFPDTYKLPTHITFSNESKYFHPPMEVGQWEDIIPYVNKGSFRASTANINNAGGIKGLKRYFNQVEPEIKLILPQQEYGGWVDNYVPRAQGGLNNMPFYLMPSYNSSPIINQKNIANYQRETEQGKKMINEAVNKMNAYTNQYTTPKINKEQLAQYRKQKQDELEWEKIQNDKKVNKMLNYQSPVNYTPVIGKNGKVSWNETYIDPNYNPDSEYNQIKEAKDILNKEDLSYDPTTILNTLNNVSPDVKERYLDYLNNTVIRNKTATNYLSDFMEAGAHPFEGIKTYFNYGFVPSGFSKAESTAGPKNRGALQKGTNTAYDAADIAIGMVNPFLWAESLGEKTSEIPKNIKNKQYKEAGLNALNTALEAGLIALPFLHEAQAASPFLKGISDVSPNFNPNLVNENVPKANYFPMSVIKQAKGNKEMPYLSKGTLEKEVPLTKEQQILKSFGLDYTKKYGGEMIKRADGSYSQRGLWDNIRANIGSGKKPTKQMLEQEKNIKAKYKDGGSLTPQKAREILHDKSVHGHPLTDKQRKFFGWISSQKKMVNGGIYFTSGDVTHEIYNKPVGNDNHVIVTHPTIDNGEWDTIDLTKIAGAKTINDGIIATEEWHKKHPYHNKKYGGWLQKFGPGGENIVKPYITSNLNDPRIQAYNDSLTYYNQGQKNLKDFLKFTDDNNLKIWHDIRTYLPIGNDRIAPIEKLGIYVNANSASNHNNAVVGKDGTLYTDDRLKKAEKYMSGRNEMGVPIYKKPVQKVIYKPKPELKTISPIRINVNKPIIEPINPISIPNVETSISTSAPIYVNRQLVGFHKDIEPSLGGEYSQEQVEELKRQGKFQELKYGGWLDKYDGGGQAKPLGRTARGVENYVHNQYPNLPYVQVIDSFSNRRGLNNSNTNVYENYERPDGTITTISGNVENIKNKNFKGKPDFYRGYLVNMGNSPQDPNLVQSVYWEPYGQPNILKPTNINKVQSSTKLPVNAPIINTPAYQQIPGLYIPPGSSEYVPYEYHSPTINVKGMRKLGQPGRIGRYGGSLHPESFNEYMEGDVGRKDPTEPTQMVKYGEGGGIPQRYKNMGFTHVGQKKAGDGKHKWKVLAKKGDKYKVVQGGWKGMQDFKQHHSEERRKKFWSRMGGKNSSKATDPFSPLYWHKRLGTWADGGQIYNWLDRYEQGGENTPSGSYDFQGSPYMSSIKQLGSSPLSLGNNLDLSTGKSYPQIGVNLNNFNASVYKGKNEPFGYSLGYTMPINTKKKKNVKTFDKGGIIEDQMGQWKYPGQVTKIKGKNGKTNITTNFVKDPLYIVSNEGEHKIMYPWENHTFKGDNVIEYPITKTGGWLDYYS